MSLRHTRIHTGMVPAVGPLLGALVDMWLGWRASAAFSRFGHDRLHLQQRGDSGLKPGCNEDLAGFTVVAAATPR